jgi:hypothetical protein
VGTILVHAVDNPSLVIVVVLDFAPNASHFAVVFGHVSYSSQLGLDNGVARAINLRDIAVIGLLD